MSARRTKASRRAAFQGWLARLAAPAAPTVAPPLSVALLAGVARRLSRALRELARAVHAAATRLARLQWPPALDTTGAPGVGS